MKVIYYPREEYTGERKACYALGFFDGVHKGHARLLAECVDCARERGLVPAVFTFRAEDDGLKGGSARLLPTERKLELIAECGIELAVVAEFSAVSRLTPEDFVKEVLAARLGCGAAVTGPGFRFGKGASGDARDLVRLMGECGLAALTVPDEYDGDKPISSTRIRELIASGRMREAAALLGRSYSVSGVVSHGLGLGKGLGFPTLNLPINDKNCLQNGVYASRVILRGESFAGITNVGRCPTVGERERHAETMIFDFSGDLYGERVEVELLEFLRPERAFSSREELVRQIDEDIRRVKDGRKMD